MGFFDSFGDLFTAPAPACEKCRAAGRGDITMEYSEAEYHPDLAATVEAYVCPHENCGHRVVASDDAQMQGSTAGTAPERDRGGGSTSVMPLDGGGFEDDDGWQSVR